jgi:ABC-2 type transport system permease protein
VAPGYLQSDRTDGERRYFEYVMDAPIWPFVSYLSARYAVARDRWNDVALEVFYHPEHHFNVQRMLQAAQKSLDYFTREFGPYQYRQFRVLEFPAYERFAQAFPNTIPYSEAIGFIADLHDDKSIDYVFYVTAHELAHQWWGHQLVGRRAQGMTLLVETLAQYSALMVMEHEYGATKMRRFLKYELDNYLANRGGELIEELPLKLVEDQGYVHYRKGSLAMYALKDAIGEDAVNRALRSVLQRYAYVETRFPLSGDLIAAFRAEAPADKQTLITALFEKITLWDLSVTDATVQTTDDGRYRVTLDVATRQLEADGAGVETEVPLDVALDVGIFGAAPDGLGENDLPEPLVLEKRHFDAAEATLEFIVAEPPVRVGIDPYNKLIDRNPDDNLLKVHPPA